MRRTALKQQWIGTGVSLVSWSGMRAKIKPLAMLKDVACAGVKV